MNKTRDLSVGELLDQLLADSLIDACHITGDTVTIVQGTKRHNFPYAQARTFLLGMLRGRSWNLNPNQNDGDEAKSPLRAVEKERENAEATADPFSSDAPASAASDAPASAASQHGAGAKLARSLAPALDELLSMAEELELIEGHDKNTADQWVMIHLSACQTQMQFDEAVVFLSECILYKLTSLKDEVDHLVGPGSDSSQERLESSADSGLKRPVDGEELVWERLG